MIANVIVDTREVNCDVPLLLDNIPELTIEQKELHIGDYQISEDIIFERKTWDDLYSSIIDGRLFNQLKDLKNNFKKPCIILEGTPGELHSGQINVVRSVLLSIALGFQVPIIPTIDDIETAQTIRRAVERLNRPSNRVIPLQNRPKPKDPIELEQFIWESFPGLGPSIAKKITEYPETLLWKLNNFETITVEGLGKKRKEDVRNLLGDD